MTRRTDMAMPVPDGTLQLVERIVDADRRLRVLSLLDEPPALAGEPSAARLAPVHAAVVRLAMTGEAGLQAAIRLYRRDVPALLALAGFADDAGAHERWRAHVLAATDA